MSTLRGEAASRALRRNAPVFAALGDATRLGLLTRLSAGAGLSITQLSQGSAVTRQAITKHLRALECAGLVRSTRQGRESHFRLETRRLDEARRSLDAISRRWDEALTRLKEFVEE